MENTLDSNYMGSGPAKRPGYLTTICVLTWIWSAWTAIGSVSSIFGPSPRENLNQMLTRAESMDGFMRRMMDKAIETMSNNIELLEKWSLPFNIITLLGAIACTYGAILMWRLRKSGFMIYVLGEWIPPVFSAAVLGPITFGSGTASIIFFVLGLGVYLTFTLMYRANLKHMRGEEDNSPA